MDKKTRLKITASLGITVGLAVLMFFSLQSRFYQILELKALDVRFVLQGKRAVNVPVVHINIDDASLASVGRWPWPRVCHAKLTKILTECGAKQVLWDVLFMEEDKENPQDDAAFSSEIGVSGNTYIPFYFVDEQPVGSQGLRDAVLKDISITPGAAAERLGVPVASVRDILPRVKKQILDEVSQALILQRPDIDFEGLLDLMGEKYDWTFFSEDEVYVQERFSYQKLLYYFVERHGIRFPMRRWPFTKEYRALNVPIRQYAEKSKGTGFIDADPDIDGVTRRVPLFIKYRDRLLPQLAVSALMDAWQVSGIEVRDGRVVLKGAHTEGAIRDVRVPVDRSGCMLVNWQGKWGESFPLLSYGRILELADVREELNRVRAGGQAEGSSAVVFLEKNEAKLVAQLKSLVSGRICIVGLTATGTHDLRPIPLQEKFPMVGTHANVINTIAAGKFIVRQPATARALIFLVTAAIISSCALLKMGRSLLLVAGYLAGYFFVCLAVFTNFGVWMDLVGPTGIAVFGFAGITSYRFFTEEKEKMWIKKAFSHYISGEVMNELIDDPSKLKLGGERRMITVLFSDVRGFTSFSEAHQPEEVVAMLNEILSEQVKVVFGYGGTLDKFVGDELMAFFGAPSTRHKETHASIAVRTAIDIQAKMVQLRRKWSQENKSALSIGIGINTGEVVVGNMGSSERMDYTIIGDNVNLGARLCAAANGDEILISGATYDLIADAVEVEKLEPIMVKGKSKPISIYRVLGLKKV